MGELLYITVLHSKVKIYIQIYIANTFVCIYIFTLLCKTVIYNNSPIRQYKRQIHLEKEVLTAKTTTTTTTTTNSDVFSICNLMNFYDEVFSAATVWAPK
jgi:hypothetical protein